MAVNFPDSPSNGDTTVINGATYTWDGVKWDTTSFASNVTATYDSPLNLPTTGLTNGDVAWVGGSTNKLYISNGTGWLSATLTNSAPVINSVQDASAGTTPFSLATDGTPTVITIDATDPESFGLTYSYSVTSGALGTTATVSQADNVFTITPGTNDPADAGTFELTFSVYDGVNTVTSVNEFTLSFVTSHNNVTAFASGGVTSSGVSDTIDYWSTAVPYTGASVFGNMSTTSYRQGALADGPGGRGCIFAGGWSPVVDTIQYITVATPGNAQAFGTISSGSKTFAGGCSDYTYGVILAGGLGSGSPGNGTQTDFKVMDRFTVQTLGNTTDHGDLVSDHTGSTTATSPAGSSRGVIVGPYGGNSMEYFDITTPSNAAVFGNSIDSFMSFNAGMSDDTYAVFGPNGTSNLSTDLEYITVDTLGNSSSFGSITHARYYCAGTDNLTYGFIVGGENSGVNSYIQQIETITIATPGNASSFGNLTIGRQAASAAAA